MFDDQSVRAVTSMVQQLTALLYALSLIACLILGARYHRYRPYLLIVLSVCLHTVLFYTLALADVLVSPWGNLWSAILRLHTGAALLGVLVALWWARANKQGTHGK